MISKERALAIFWADKRSQE